MVTAGTVTDTCSRCGSKLVRSIATRGVHAGQPLLRCSDLSCPTIINLDVGTVDVTPPAPVAGESAQAEFERLRLERTERIRRVGPYLAASGVLVSVLMGSAALALTADLRWAGVCALLAALAFVWPLARPPAEILWWKKGAEAERAVGARLDGLERKGFITLYDRRIPGRGGNIDAVTVGPTGVYVIETKYRGRGVEVIQGRFEVGGIEQADVVRQVTELAMLVQVSVAQAMNRYRLTTVPIICVGNRTVEGEGRAGGIQVLDAKSIARTLSNEPAMLAPADVQELAGLLNDALPPYQRR